MSETPSVDELDALTTEELRHRAFALAEHKHDLRFFWDIVKHMKDLCEDLQPRGGHGGNWRSAHNNERSPQRTDSFR